MSQAIARRYRVEYLIAHPVCESDAVRDQLVALLAAEPQLAGIAVAGDGTLIKVHVTTARPEVALAVGRAAGTLFDVIVEPRCGIVPRERAA
ncbi:MAG TPA: hypothetical protein VFC31_00945 [Candidatus Limnocylindria bacterium]|nr:hypothetical protein [Candidatus Limnocylindria bacterium]